jgi:hypothetical protein
MSAARPITAFAQKADGRRNRGFEIDGCTVLVTPGNASDEEAAAVTARLADLDEQLKLAQALFTGTNAAFGEALAKIPPKRPARMLGDGCVRFLDGRLFLLNRRERGFGEFGVECDDWDDLFRRFNVKITEYGTDQHGAWWTAVPA